MALASNILSRSSFSTSKTSPTSSNKSVQALIIPVMLIGYRQDRYLVVIVAGNVVNLNTIGSLGAGIGQRVWSIIRCISHHDAILPSIVKRPAGVVRGNSAYPVSSVRGWDRPDPVCRWCNRGRQVHSCITVMVMLIVFVARRYWQAVKNNIGTGKCPGNRRVSCTVSSQGYRDRRRIGASFSLRKKTLFFNIFSVYIFLGKDRNWKI